MWCSVDCIGLHLDARRVSQTLRQEPQGAETGSSVLSSPGAASRNLAHVSRIQMQPNAVYRPPQSNTANTASRFQSGMPQHIVSYHPSSPISSPSQHSSASAHVSRMQREFSDDAVMCGSYYANPADVLQNPALSSNTQATTASRAAQQSPFASGSNVHSAQYYNNAPAQPQQHSLTHHIPVTSPANSAAQQQQSTAVNHLWNVAQQRPLVQQQQQQQRPASAHSGLARTSKQVNTRQEQPLEYDKQDPYLKWRHFYVNQKNQLSQYRFFNQQPQVGARDEQGRTVTQQEGAKEPLDFASASSNRDVSNVRATERIRSATPDALLERPNTSRQLPSRPSSANAKTRCHLPQSQQHQPRLTSEQDRVTSDSSYAHEQVDQRATGGSVSSQQPVAAHRSQRKQLPAVPAAATSSQLQHTSPETGVKSKERSSGRSSARSPPD